MNTSQKIIKYIALAFGIVLSINIISAIVFGITTIAGILINVDKGENKDTIPKNSQLISLSEYTDIHELDIKLNAYNLTIKEGESFKIETDQAVEELTYYKEDNTLIIKDDKNINFTFKNEEKNILLYIPKDFRFNTVKIKNNVGKCNIEYIEADKLDLDFGVGETIIENIVADFSNIKGGVGKVQINNFNFKTLDLETGLGEFNLSGKVQDNANINCGIGKVDINLLGTLQEYSINTKIGIGSINLNDNKCSNSNTYGNGDSKMYITGGIGKVNIRTNNI